MTTRNRLLARRIDRERVFPSDPDVRRQIQHEYQAQRRERQRLVQPDRLEAQAERIRRNANGRMQDVGWSSDGLEWVRRAAVKAPARSRGPQVDRDPWVEKFNATVGARLGEQGLAWPDRDEVLIWDGEVVAVPDLEEE